jgi:hypothetical protein
MAKLHDLTTRKLIRYSVILLITLTYHSLQCQEQIDSIKIVDKTAGYSYMYQGEKISFAALGRIMFVNPMAFNFYQKAFINRTAGNVVLVAGVVCVIFGSIATIGQANDNREPKKVFTGVWVDHPLMALSIPFTRLQSITW